MLQFEVDVVDAGLTESGVAFQGLQGLKVESTEGGFFSEHGAGQCFAVGCAQVGDPNGVDLAQDVGHVQRWKQVRFVQCATVGGDLLRGQVCGVAVAFDAHAGRLHAQAYVAAQPLVDTGVQHGIGADHIEESEIGVARVADVVGLDVVSALGDHHVGSCEVLGGASAEIVKELT